MAKLSIKHVLVAGALIIAPIFVLADNASSTSASNARKMLNQELRQKQAALKQEAQKKRQALEAEMKTKRDALMQEMKMKRQTFEQEKQQRIDALKKKLGDERAKKIEQFFNNMVKKFEAAIDRLNKLADRIDALLNKAAAAGKDVSAQKTALQAARVKITAVETALGDAKTQFGAMAKSADPKTAFQKVKELVRGVEQKIKDAHSALVNVVSSTKGL